MPPPPVFRKVLEARVTVARGIDLYPWHPLRNLVGRDGVTPIVLLLLLLPDVAAYRTWTCVTPQAVDMAPAIAVSCVGPASWDASKDNPHVPKRFKVWVNPVGRATMAKPYWEKVSPGRVRPAPVRFPEGTVIVKEKFDASPGSQAFFGQKPPKPLPAEPELLTIMAKGAKGSKPTTGDWSYYVADGKGQRLDGSSETKCASCHAARSAQDFTFRGYGQLTR